MSVLAINGGSPVRTKPFSAWPVFDEREEQAVLNSVRSGAWGLGGPSIPVFEQRFAEYQEAKYGICVMNGTVSLIVALRAAGVGYGDEVIVPPFTFMATASSVLEVGGIPVFADIDPDTYCLDPDCIEAAITPKTKVIIPVHLAGHPADMDRIMDIAERHNLIVIEDAAHAHGSEWKGRRVGAIGHMGSFSFQSSKNLNCGEGGIIVTNHEKFADLCFSFHNCGRIRTGQWYEHHVLGQNFRIGEFQASILLAQMERLDEQNKVRQENAMYLASRLSEVGGIIPQKRDPRVTAHAYHCILFRYIADEFSGASRGAFLNAVNAEGIPFGTSYNRPLYKEQMFVSHGIDYSGVECPEAQKATDQGIWFHHAVALGTKLDMDDIVEAVVKVKEHSDELRES
ncbi:MAG: DegT/DnrJ/EryC1/StrS family aminotransferase [Armatimonadota bacterium]